MNKIDYKKGVGVLNISLRRTDFALNVGRVSWYPCPLVKLKLLSNIVWSFLSLGWIISLKVASSLSIRSWLRFAIVNLASSFAVIFFSEY